MECSTSRVKLLGLLALTIIMVGACAFCTTLPEIVPQVVGWVGVAFFGLGFVVFPARFFRAGPQVVIDAAGIDDRRSPVGMIPWDDIRSVSIGSVHSSRFLCVELVEPAQYLARLPSWQRPLIAANQALGFPGLTISFAGLSPGIDEAWAYIEQNVVLASADPA